MLTAREGRLWCTACTRSATCRIARLPASASHSNPARSGLGYLGEEIIIWAEQTLTQYAATAFLGQLLVKGIAHSLR